MQAITTIGLGSRIAVSMPRGEGLLIIPGEFDGRRNLTDCLFL
jgi:hypothetical protein